MAASLGLSAVTLMAQNDNGGGPGGGGFGGGPGGGGFGGGNFDPAQMQQQMQERQIENIRTQLDLTNDTDWSAIQPLVQKVLDDKRAVGNVGNGMAGMFGGGRGGRGGPGGRGGNRMAGLFGEPSPEQQALQAAVDNNAPMAQIQNALDTYEKSQKEKLATLAKDQEALRAVLQKGKQEAAATLLGLVP
ncbi:MAG TPA: hypothetical protein VIK35_07095 [Verrucomicrobiae bacterium]